MRVSLEQSVFHIVEEITERLKVLEEAQAQDERPPMFSPVQPGTPAAELEIVEPVPVPTKRKRKYGIRQEPGEETLNRRDVPREARLEAIRRAAERTATSLFRPVSRVSRGSEPGTSGGAQGAPTPSSQAARNASQSAKKKARKVQEHKEKKKDAQKKKAKKTTAKKTTATGAAPGTSLAAPGTSSGGLTTYGTTPPEPEPAAAGDQATATGTAAQATGSTAQGTGNAPRPMNVVRRFFQNYGNKK